MPRLTNDDRGRAVGMLAAGVAAREVAAIHGVHHTTIYRLQRRVAIDGAVCDRPRPGRPRVTTYRQDRGIRLAHLRNRFHTAAATARTTIGLHGLEISSRTVRRRLAEGGLSSRRPYVGPILTDRHRRVRREWALNDAYLDDHGWRDVVFSDESRFSLGQADGRVRVYRRSGERYADACVMERNRLGGPSVMVWGAINSLFRSDLVVIEGNLNARRYIDEILQPAVVPLMQRHGGVEHFVFQQDNARPHSANITQAFLREHGIRVMPWPSLSPDMNCIEHLWDILGRRVYQHIPRPQTRAQLVEALLHHWHAIPLAQIRTLVRSMPNRLRACLNANGGHTRY